MPLTTFDTLRYVRRLKQAGMPSALAEIQAEVLTEAFNVNLESPVTRDFLAARFAEQDARFESRFAHLEAKIDGNFRFFLWTQAIVMSAVIFTYLERLVA